MQPALYRSLLSPDQLTCSTLVRAVIDATTGLAEPRRDGLVLQYPRSGRYRCNQLDVFMSDHPTKQLAVPSFGPLSMQSAKAMQWGIDMINLQYPRSGRYRCNSVAQNAALVKRCLQYPRSGRYRCNLDCWLDITATTALQYPRSGRYRCNHGSALCSSVVSCLQYPRSGRYRCNQPALHAPEPGAPHLQYPRSGRYRCNLPGEPRARRFSVLAVPSFGPLSMQPCCCC